MPTPTHWLILATLIWGLTFTLIRGALETVDPVVFIALRFGLAVPLCWLLFRRRMRLGEGVVFRRGLLLGSVLFLGYLLQTLGLVHTSASRSGVFTSLAVVFVPLLMIPIEGRRPRGGVLLAVLLALGGVALMNSGGAHEGTAPTLLGDLLTIGCALAFSVQILLMDRVPTAGSTWTLTFWQVLTVAVLATTILPLRTPLTLEWTPALAVALVFCGLLATVFALALQIRFQREIRPEKAAMIYTLEPVFAGGFAFVLGGERLGPAELLGSLLIVTGLFAVELDRARLRAWRNRLFN